MNRAEFQKLAHDRLADAKALLNAKRWSAGYYLAGYAVECALKSCILVRLAAGVEVVFVDRRFSEKCWTHDLEQLVDLAGLKSTLVADCSADADLRKNWETVEPWNEASRYEQTTKIEAVSLYHAIADKKHGVLPWIAQRW